MDFRQFQSAAFIPGDAALPDGNHISLGIGGDCRAGLIPFDLGVQSNGILLSMEGIQAEAGGRQP